MRRSDPEGLEGSIRAGARALLAAAVAAVLALGPAAEAANDFYGSVNLHRELTETKIDGEVESDWTTTEVVRLGLVRDLTSRLSFAGDLNVNQIEREEGTTTRMSPDLRLNLDSEWFDSSLGHRIQEDKVDFLTFITDDEEDRLTSKTWQYNISSKIKDYPDIRLGYTRDTMQDHLDVRETDNVSTNYSGNADYTWRFLNMGLTHNRGNTKDLVNQVDQESRSNSAQTSFSKSFLANRLSTAGSFSYASQITETKNSAGDFDLDANVLATHGLFFAGAPPVGTGLNVEDDLIDGDTATSAGINIGGVANTNQHIGLEFSRATEVSKLLLHTTDVAFVANDFTFALYTSDDNLTWTLVAAAAAKVYRDAENYFELTFTPLTTRFIKIVNTANAIITPIFVTELEAFSTTTLEAFSETETTSLSKSMQGNLGYRVFDWMELRYAATQDTTRSEPGDSDTRQNSHTMSAALDRILHPKLRSAALLQRRLDTDSEERSRTSDTGSLSFSSNPLRRLETSLSTSANLNKIDSQIDSRSESALLHTAAALRKGADLEVDWSENHQHS